MVKCGETLFEREGFVKVLCDSPWMMVLWKAYDATYIFFQGLLNVSSSLDHPVI